ncbi:stimulator of interferon genes [Pelobates cultripes]|uniref:Stimulator of interferon genes protein n=2 Tax=Pelobates cultripes TaxID=61616 RepID=A0AAD1RRI7_PELCU|nr:stimulator of interferon genes [Pelobates cultripes]
MFVTRIREETHDRNIIPEARGHRATKTVCICIAICIIVLYTFGIGNYSITQIVFSLSVFFLSIPSWNLIVGICEFSEEIKHVNARYNGHYLKAFKASFNTKYMSVVIPSFILCYIFYEEEYLPNFPRKISFFLILLAHFLAWLLGIQETSPAGISKIIEKKHFNVAHGLAWSYYVGYLKFVLPELKNLVKKFNEENNNLLKSSEMCKLHILIPLSCKLYGDLNEGDENITFLKEIPPLCKDRAGIKGRVFKNNVYRILDEEHRPYYCIVEYATPLASLLQMSDIASAAFSAEDRIQQTKLFYRTLKEILENSLECQNSFRLIVYDDSPKDKMYQPHMLSTEILKHLKQQHSEEYNLNQDTR